MKNLMLSITLVFGALCLAQAQDEVSKNKSNGGLKGGYSLAAVEYDGEGETGQRSGFHIGLYGESYFSDIASIQIELLYSQQGYEIKNDSGTFTQKLNYINLPLSLKIYPVSTFYLEAGPQIGYAISHKETYDANFNLFDTSQEFTPNNFDYGVNFGAGFKTEGGVSFGARYHLGLGDIYDEGKPSNRVWQFSVGFDF
ncbi:porin family protein [Olleya aquimaris]|uniref:Outer membrane protein with beta-barrel domain n=1 Tax=Olleya aquimaris TaxID=639310 RepID=A0A327R9V1_9FLAO|nr:porin family protein [Olleya aquimaris]RAJ13491.1 outer membrane protein with beta-barrel domain [Olleya aquimaris]